MVYCDYGHEKKGEFSMCYRCERVMNELSLTPDKGVRVGATDRAASIELLITAHAEGYLTEAELVDRMHKTTEAAYRSDLVGLHADLPEKFRPNGASPKSGKFTTVGDVMILIVVFCIIGFVVVMAIAGIASLFA